MFPELELHEMEYICNSIKSFFIENNLLEVKKIKTENKPGILHCINNLNFSVKRFFYLNNFNDIAKKNKRGLHANLNFNEFIVVIQGSIKIKLIDKNSNEENVVLNDNETFYISNMKWVEYEILDENTIILCLVDKDINESISIFNFEDFKNM